MSAKQPHYGVFTRTMPNGAQVRRVADTPETAVSLAFDGWAPEKPATAKTAEDANLHPLSGSINDNVPAAAPAADKSPAPAGSKPAGAATK